MILARDPICKACGSAPSTEVDHVVGKADGGDDSAENLQGLCAGCHKIKTAGQASVSRATRRRRSGPKSR